MLEKLVFLVVMLATPGADGEWSSMPPQHAAALYEVALHHGQDPYEVGAVIMAENKGRVFHALEVGRYRGGQEAGIAQLKPMWAYVANARCNARLREAHRHYAGRGDCLFIEPEQTLRYKLRKNRNPDQLRFRMTTGREHSIESHDAAALVLTARARGWRLLEHRMGEVIGEPRDVDLFMIKPNLEAAVIAYEEMSRWQRKHAPWLSHWQYIYRCSPAAYSRRGGVTRGCKNSVARVLAWEQRLRDHRSEWGGVAPLRTADAKQ